MTVKELQKNLKGLPPNLEVILGVKDAAGFSEYDHIDVYPIEHVVQINTDTFNRPPIHGYWNDEENKDKVLLYVFP